MPCAVRGGGAMTPRMNRTGIVKRSVRIAGHATSVSLEPAFWQALQEIARRRRVSLGTLLAAIDAERRGNLSSAIRLFVLDECRRGVLAPTSPADVGSRQSG